MEGFAGGALSRSKYVFSSARLASSRMHGGSAPSQEEHDKGLGGPHLKLAVVLVGSRRLTQHSSHLANRTQNRSSAPDLPAQKTKRRNASDYKLLLPNYAKR